MKQRIKIQGFLIFVAVMMTVFFYKYLLPDSRERMLSDILDVLGMVIFLSGYLLRIIARGYKAELNPDGRTLVTDGPYAFTRNPMYLGTLLIGLGIILVLFRWWVGIIFLAAYLAIYLPQISREEEKLANFFGQAFKDYQKATPRYFPNLIKIIYLFSRSHLYIKTSWIKKEIYSLLSALMFIIGVKIWEDVRLFGQINYKKELLKLAVLVIIFCSIFIFNRKGKNVSGENKNYFQ